MTQTANPAFPARARRTLMMSCASAALAAAAFAPQAARAQALPTGAFQGSITGTTGAVTRTPTTNTTETITVGSPTATINWSPTSQQGSGAIDFLPAGNTATFTSASGVTDYTVLNRILPTTSQPIGFNGHVVSTLQGTSAIGGNVWFYSPNGIVVGARAVFDVGGLLLTTNDVTSFGATANGFNASLSGPAGSNARVRIENGAHINALQQNSYVALVAPRIQQGGTVRVNGSAAYAAGEQLSMTMNQGLFDIQVDVGTSDANGIVHTGETSGPANAAAADNHGIYMVAVPKNQALTMLLSGGSVGFDATSAQVQNGQIVLSAGYDVGHLGSAAVIDGLQLGDNIGGPSAGISIAGGTYGSSVHGAATGDIIATGGGGTLAFDGDVNLQGLRSSSLLAQSGDTIAVGGSATISADNLKTGATQGEGANVDASGGTASIRADTGGSINIAGDVLVSAFALGTVNSATGELGTSRAGMASIEADGGKIAVGGNSKVAAIGNGWRTYEGFDGRDAFGGMAQVTATGAGSVTFAGRLEVNADGDGGFSALGSGGAGGDGIAGSAAMTAGSNGSIQVGGYAIVSATGYGGGIVSSPDGTNGAGQGGWAELAATNGGSLTFQSGLGVSASGNGAPFGNPTVRPPLQGGEGDGGTANLLLDGGAITVVGDAWIGAQGIGSTGQTGGAGYGGSVTAEITGGEGYSQGGNLNVTGSLVLAAGGTGGAGLDNPAGAGGQGGAGYAGYASFYVTPDLVEGATASLSLGRIIIDVGTVGGAGGDGLTGGNGGNAYGAYHFDRNVESAFGLGGANFDLYGGAGTVGAIGVGSVAAGGAGGAGSAGVGGNGGDAFGGDSAITIGGTLVAASGGAHASAKAIGGDGGGGSTQGDGGQAWGGNASLDVIQGGDLTGDVQLVASAFGGAGDTGGNATGGDSSIAIGGTLKADSFTQFAGAVGGNGVIAGGGASGGYADFDVSGGMATFSGAAQFDASAIGGNASNGDGGFASGGSIGIYADGGSLAAGDLTANASATGGNGNFAGGASGGSIDVHADSWDSEAATSLAFDQLTLTANAVLGWGAADESGGSGGYVNLESSGGAINANALSIQANGARSGGTIGIQSNVDGNNLGGGLAFGVTDASANGGDSGGFIFVGSGAGSTVDLGDASLRASGGFGGSVYLLAGGCAECGGGQDLRLAETPLLPAGGGISASNLTLDAAGSIVIGLAGGADVSVTGTLQGTAGQFISLIDDGAGGAIRAHEIDLTGITIDDSADLVADIIKLTTAGAMSLGNLDASDSMTLTAGGDLTAVELTAANGLTLNSGGNVQTGKLAARNVDVTAAGGTTVGDVDAPGSARFTAGGLAAFGGIVRSPTITVTSGDIDIANGASLGVSGVTDLITLNALGNGQPIVIGAGPAAEGRYHLDENGDIRSTAVTINADNDVQVFDVRIEGGTTPGGGVGSVALNSEGSVLVNGLVDFVNAGAADKLAITAADGIEVNTDLGGIQLTDSGGKLAGTLSFTARHVWVGNRSLLTELEANPNFAGRNAALATGPAAPNQNGFVRAGAVTAAVADSFLVQNSGTPNLFAGVDTGGGGLSIQSTGSSPATIIAYGRQTRSDGVVITNQDFLNSVDVSGAAGFTPDSAVNGCSIGGSCNPLTFTIDMASILGPLDQDKDKKDKKDEGDSRIDPSLRLINTTPIKLDHSIDEPVTSGGDVVTGAPGGAN